MYCTQRRGDVHKWVVRLVAARGSLCNHAPLRVALLLYLRILLVECPQQGRGHGVGRRPAEPRWSGQAPWQQGRRAARRLTPSPPPPSPAVPPANRHAVTVADPTCGASLLADQCSLVLVVLFQGMLALGEARRGGSPYVGLVWLVHAVTLALMLAV